MKRLLMIGTIMAAAVPFGVMKAAPGHAQEGSIEISAAAARPAAAGPSETFTGEVTVQPLFDPLPTRHTGAAQVTFAPCARTAWHSHPAGQTLIVTSGTGWVQEWGGAKQQMNPGDVLWTPPDVKHWHGATDSTDVSHIATQEFVDGEPVVWMEHVTDEQYFG